MTYCRMVGEWDCENDSPQAYFINLRTYGSKTQYRRCWPLIITALP